MCQQALIISRFRYRDLHRRLGICRIEAIRLADYRLAVIATELKSNPGMSITNAAEYIATGVCWRLGVDPHKIVWIELYGYPAPGDSSRKRTYDLVTFDQITPGIAPFFHEPHWRVMKDEDWRALGLEPRTSPF